jgi:hypothetical protein
VLRQEKNLTAAAREAKISPERLRHYATEKNIIERRGRRWTVRHDLPRRMLLFSNGSAVQVVVGDFDAASKIGRFMSAVGTLRARWSRSVSIGFGGRLALTACSLSFGCPRAWLRESPLAAPFVTRRRYSARKSRVPFAIMRSK